MGNIKAVSRLAVKVHTAYKDAQDDYRHIVILDGVESLQSVLDKAAQHFESTTQALDNNNQQEGQKILKGCRNVLGDLSSLIEKHHGLASSNTTQVSKRVELATEDTATLRARLISNTDLLNGFLQRFDIPLITV